MEWAVRWSLGACGRLWRVVQSRAAVLTHGRQPAWAVAEGRGVAQCCGGVLRGVTGAAELWESCGVVGRGEL